MILEIQKQLLSDDPTPEDAPPSYDELGSQLRIGSSTTASGFPTEKGPGGPSTSSDQLRGSPSRSTLFPPLTAVSPSSSSSSSSSSIKGKAKANWFTNFTTTSRTTREVRTTILGLVRDIVREHNPHSHAVLGILQSCADACAAHSVSLSSILQEKSVEGHTPLYWAIIKRAPDKTLDEFAQVPDLLTALLSFSSPLTKSTISELRLACLVTSDQLLFQRLRLSPEFSPISGADQMILGATLPQDEITVEDVPGDEGSFAANFVIVQFQKRMRVSKEIVLEFIAKGRMWRFVFFIAEDDYSRVRKGAWGVSLSLSEHSSPSWIDSRLLIPEPLPMSANSPSSPQDYGVPQGSTYIRRFSTPTSARARPTISLRLNSQQQLAATSHRRHDEITRSLDDSLMGTSLQYIGTSYIAEDEKLRARLEAKLAKPEAECIIC